MNNFQEKVNFIWSIADKLRGDFKRHEYADVILPLVVLRRLDAAMAPTRPAVRQAYQKYHGRLENLDPVLTAAAGGSPVYNTSAYDWKRLLAAPKDLQQNFIAYLNGFGPEVQDIIEKFDFRRQVARLHASDLLFLVLNEFKTIDLHPDQVDNMEMGYIFEELIRRFSEQYNETAGEHFTPREVIRLMVALLFSHNGAELTQPNFITTVFDPACGTGGMLTETKNYILQHNPQAQIILFGQELNPTAYAVCKSDMLVKDENTKYVTYGNSFSEDGHRGRKFNLMLSNPPFGVEWRKVEKVVRREHESRGFDGRFGPGLPRISDGSLLFLLHMLGKMKRDDGGSRIAIVFNASPLFTGDAGSGESEIRRWILENDWLEGIVALPDQLFYNTGISTYVWILSNRKPAHRRGKVQLVNAVDFYQKMRRSLGNKRNEISDQQRAEIAALYRAFQEGGHCRIFDAADFGYRKIRVERPLRLNFQAGPERIARLHEERAFANLASSRKKGPAARQAQMEAGKAQQQKIIAALEALPPDLLRDPAQFQPLLDRALKPLKLNAALKKAALAALTERDESARPMRDRKGKPLPDPELRDYENVPLKEDVGDYFRREALPYVPDAWIDATYCDERDQQVGRIGYQINFNRYFYTYTSARPLEEIEADLRAVEEEIAALLAEASQ